MGVRGQRRATAEYQPNPSTKHLLGSSEDKFVEERCIVTTFIPFQFVLVGEVEDRLPEGPGPPHLLVDAFGDAVEDELYG